MKVLISFRPEKKSAPFETTRLRKNIKGALELSGTNYVENIAASPDIAHILSPLETDLVQECLEENVPYVVSALYCEDDEDGAFLLNNKKGSVDLTSKAKKVLTNAKVILVPSQFAYYTLKALGISNRIEVVPPGVNLARFESLNAIEYAAFARYFRFSSDSKFVLGAGRFLDSNVIESVKKLSNYAPNIRFFFIDYDYQADEKKIRKIQKTLPKNVIVTSLLDDDLYRSALMGASAFLVFGGPSSYNEITLYEVFASKTPVLVIDGNMEDGLLNRKTAYFADNLEKTAEYLVTLSPSVSSSFIIDAYKKSEEGSLKKIGEKLVDIYRSVLSKEEK